MCSNNIISRLNTKFLEHKNQLERLVGSKEVVVSKLNMNVYFYFFFFYNCSLYVNKFSKMRQTSIKLQMYSVFDHIGGKFS